MRKVIVSNLMSLDGFIAGSNGEIDWFVVDKDAQLRRRHPLLPARPPTIISLSAPVPPRTATRD
jgi:hypothetical protein